MPPTRRAHGVLHWCGTTAGHMRCRTTPAPHAGSLYITDAMWATRRTSSNFSVVSCPRSPTGRGTVGLCIAANNAEYSRTSAGRDAVCTAVGPVPRVLRSGHPSALVLKPYRGWCMPTNPRRTWQPGGRNGERTATGYLFGVCPRAAATPCSLRWAATATSKAHGAASGVFSGGCRGWRLVKVCRWCHGQAGCLRWHPSTP